ncbi:MAG: nucleoside triphosphate pyrophosphohydrolase [Gammaproteobacteria bacterium]|jgi:MazG family protein|nr:nucleoside triphosphate pyrophosphohydrolase [Gammaproteobacteria bacterium]
MEKLLDIMAKLRDPDKGCPWDREQDFRSIAPYTIEEAYEVADAIERNDLQDLRHELGDLLLQVVFHAQMADEQGAFDFGQVVDGICSKMIRRHPHVFGDRKFASSEEQTADWERHKAAERAEKDGNGGVLAGVSPSQPGLSRAIKLGKRAATVGFDWPDADRVMEKVREELEELDQARHSDNQDEIEEELGDLLFSMGSLARHLDIDPESALRRAALKFESRFGQVENHVRAQGRPWQDWRLEELEELWQQAKTDPVSSDR